LSEKATRRTLIAATPTLDPHPIETRSTVTGFPDYECVSCLVETKCERKGWPKRPNTPVSLHHPLTTEQYKVLNARWRAGGAAFVLLQVRRLEWLLFAAPDSGPLRTNCGVPKLQLIHQYALMYWENGLPEHEITWWLSRDWRTLEDKRLEHFGENAIARTGQ
jgi:hypothetical protein